MVLEMREGLFGDMALSDCDSHLRNPHNIGAADAPNQKFSSSSYVYHVPLSRSYPHHSTEFLSTSTPHDASKRISRKYVSSAFAYLPFKLIIKIIQDLPPGISKDDIFSVGPPQF